MRTKNMLSVYYYKNAFYMPRIVLYSWFPRKKYPFVKIARKHLFGKHIYTLYNVRRALSRNSGYLLPIMKIGTFWSNPKNGTSCGGTIHVLQR